MITEYGTRLVEAWDDYLQSMPIHDLKNIPKVFSNLTPELAAGFLLMQLGYKVKLALDCANFMYVKAPLENLPRLKLVIEHLKKAS